MRAKQATPNPYTTANFLSRLTFWWLMDIFRLGKSNDLREENLYDVLPEDDSEFLGEQLDKSWENELAEAEKENRKPSLRKAIRKTVGWLMVKQGMSNVVPVICKIIQPVLLGKLIVYFNPMSKMTLEEAYVYGSGLLLVNVLHTTILRNTLFGQYLLGMRVRIACSSLLYRKLLKLSCASRGVAANGLIINVMSNDLPNLEKFFIYVHFLWTMPLTMTLISYLVWQQLGLAGFIGILFAVMQVVPTQVIWYKVIAKLRTTSASRTDKRVLLIGEIINGIRVVKMYAWERYFERLVQLARKYEIDILLKQSYIRGSNFAMGEFTDRTALFCAIAIYVLHNGIAITADKMFSTVYYFVLVRHMTGKLFSDAVFFTSASNVAVRRMEDFLSRTETEAHQYNPLRIIGNKSAITLEKINATWSNRSNVCLSNANLSVASQKLHAVVGPVGSGKSSLLKVILGELQPTSGQLSVHGKVSFASQEPWLFSGSARDNILFGEEYNEERYKKVIDVCQLAKDFEQLPFADKTLVGERGMSLSGGQCARINLARAVYRDADVYLFDDPLSAVDSCVSRHLFEKCVSGYLREKTRILVTHQVQYLQKTDGIIVMNKGQIEFDGTYQSFIANNKYLELLSQTNDEDKQETDVKNRLNSQLSVSVEKQEGSNVKEEPEETQESVSNGQNNTLLLFKYFRAGNSNVKLSVMVVLFLLTQLAIGSFEYWLSYWTKQEDKRQGSVKNANFTNVTISSLRETDDYLDKETALCVSGCLVIAIVVLSNLKNLWFFKRSLNSSKAIHDAMFARLLRAPMQFFNVNPSGRMLNRFSKDTGTVDDEMPNVTMEVVEKSLTILSVFVQILVVNWWLVGPMLIVGYCIVKVNQLYLSTAQALKRLEGNAKSPVFSLVNSTLLGLATIRSCRAQSIVNRKFDERQNAHTAAQYLCHGTTVAYGMWLDFLAATFLSFMVYSFIPIKSASTMGGDVGLALTQFLSVCGILQYVMRHFAELMAQMIALERMFQYTELEQEGFARDSQVQADSADNEDWPTRGDVRFQDLNLKYSDKEQPVLKNLNFSIRSNTKVGIVGRTGAGKSSLIAALFRLAHFDGSIFIDDVDTKRISLLNLRSKISIIPQEPTLFTASLRDNLDPLGRYDDASLWSALQDVEMHKLFESLEQLIDGNLSAGQRQLLCLARAIVRKNKILILDEATANLDLVTDEFIQRTIRSKFQDCTVITIAHRLNTVMDSDAILVMDAGQVVEFDQPRNLLRKNNGYFSKVVQESGSAANLRKIADKAYNESLNYQSAESISTNHVDETTQL